MIQPKVGETWRGGIYAGITRNNEHLVLQYPHASRRDMTFINGGMSIESGWRLPTRAEAALLYANLQEWFEDMWYWTSDEYPADNRCHWVQTFGYGRQADARDTDACRVCAVKTFPVES